MGSTENFCLRWNDFESNVSGAFRDLRAESDFFDVTLTCDDTKRTMQAHKVILGACSPFFKNLLRTQQAAGYHPNPLIYLRGVRGQDLESVLDFMYHGEVNVAQDDLNSFLAVAEDLQIKGLTQNTASAAAANAAKRGKKNSLNSSTPSSSSSAAKRMKKSDDDINVKNEPDVSGGTGGGAGAVSGDDDFPGTDDAEVYDETYAEGDDSYGGAYVDQDVSGEAGPSGAGGGAEGMEQDSTKAPRQGDPNTDFNALVDGLMTYENGVHTCNLCGKKSPWRTTMVRHVESNHVETAGHVCDVCGVVSKTRHAFAMHKRRKHHDGGATSTTRKTKGQQQQQQQQQQLQTAGAEVVDVTVVEAKGVILG